MSAHDLGLLLLVIAMLVNMGGLVVGWGAKVERERRGEPGYPLSRSPLGLLMIVVSGLLLLASGVLIFGT